MFDMACWRDDFQATPYPNGHLPPLLGDHGYKRAIVVAGSDRQLTKLPAESRESEAGVRRMRSQRLVCRGSGLGGGGCGTLVGAYMVV